MPRMTQPTFDDRTAPVIVGETSSPTDAELRADLGAALTRVLMRQRGDYASDLARDGVSAAQISVLMKLRLYGDLSISGLAALMGLGLPNVTGIVDRLEERGLVERLRDPDDRRVVHVRLTVAGCRIPDGMDGLQRDLLGRVLAAMDRASLERCIRVVDDVEKEAGPAPVDPRCAGDRPRAKGA
jgi:MarR family transcriptional regulator, lower aerobic nicotinate degradation pathway regulator